MIVGSKNKGDWGEFYALLYLLATRKLYTADENLNKIDDYFFPILKVMRDEKRQNKEVNHIDYVLKELNGIDMVEIYVDSVLRRTMTSQEFREEAERLVVDIPAADGPQFTINHGEQFLNNIFLERLAAPATEITDIKMELHDTNTGRNQDMGFSIKSYLGGNPTLLNASDATNLVYEVIGLTQEQMEVVNEINTSRKIIDRIEQIRSFGGTLIYSHTANSNFSSNLMMIDSWMEKILSELLLFYYQSNTKDCNQIIEHIESLNPLNYPRPGFYIYKFKKFLCAKALGMEPSKEWGGMDEANGGYIAVKSDGNVLAYHLYNRDMFEKYLLDNTYFERGSTSKHHYASVYEHNGKMYMNLNVQIRFYGDER